MNFFPLEALHGNQKTCPDKLLSGFLNIEYASKNMDFTIQLIRPLLQEVELKSLNLILHKLTTLASCLSLHVYLTGLLFSTG